MADKTCQSSVFFNIFIFQSLKNKSRSRFDQNYNSIFSLEVYPKFNKEYLIVVRTNMEIFEIHFEKLSNHFCSLNTVLQLSYLIFFCESFLEKRTTGSRGNFVATVFTELIFCYVNSLGSISEKVLRKKRRDLNGRYKVCRMHFCYGEWFSRFCMINFTLKAER